MPRTEARIFTSIWSDPDFLSLPVSAQRLYMFLLTQRELSYCGVMALRPNRWIPKAAGLTRADIERDLKELEGTAYPSAHPSPEGLFQVPVRRPFVITDSDTGEIFVRSLLRRDSAWKQPNLLKLAIDSSEEIESPGIRAALLAEIERLPVDESPSAQVRTLIAEWRQILKQGTAYPSAHPSPNPPDNPANEGSGEGADNPPDDPTGDPSENPRARARLLQPPSSVLQPPTSMSSPAAPDRKQGTRLPDDFEEQIRARQDLADWFRENCPHVNGKRELEQFCDYWRAQPGKDGRKVDWVATWRRWMRTAEDRSGPRQRYRDAGKPTTTARAQQAIEAGKRVQAMLKGES